MILGSIFSSIISPFANLFGQILALFYGFTHSFGLSIVLLTLLTMVIVFPLTRKGTRSMMRMQLFQPELMRLRNKYKTQPGATAEERQANRVKQNEEMMALYRENGISPTGGCLPMFLQFPIFIVLYDTIRGMTRTVTVGTGAHAHSVLSPQYIPKNSALYDAVVHSHGVLGFLGINLADSVRTPGPISQKIPYIVLILVAVVLQYVSMWQITNRNPAAAQANPQMQTFQKFMPLIFVFFYIVLPAGVGVYFVVSSAFRVVQQEYMYKHDPKIVEAMKEIQKKRAIETTAKAGKPTQTGKDQPALGGPAAGSRKGFRERLRDAAAGLQGGVGGGTASNGSSSASTPSAGTGGGGSRPAARNGSSTGGSARTPAGKVPPSRGGQNRSRDKRPRRS